MAHNDRYLEQEICGRETRHSCNRGENMPMAMRPVLALSLAMLWTSPAFAAMDSSVEVWKSAICTCCGNWVKHLEANGLLPTVHPTEPGMLAEIK
jgi:hypothetical protein